MKILGIDPGYDRCGVAIVERVVGHNEQVLASGCITTSRDTSFEERLVAWIQIHNPDLCVLERLYFTKNQKTAMRVAETRGALIAAITQQGVNVKEYGPGEIKVAITGNGRASKEQVIKMVQQITRIQTVDAFDDEYDAVAVALTAFATLRTPQFPTE